MLSVMEVRTVVAGWLALACGACASGEVAESRDTAIDSGSVDATRTSTVPTGTDAGGPDLGGDAGEASDVGAGDGGVAEVGVGLDAEIGDGPDVGMTEDSGLPEGVHPDIVRVIPVPGRDPRSTWSDSYSVQDACYCASTFDHDIGEIEVETPQGLLTVRDACARIGPGPGSEGRPVYNDIQCGNGPPNSAGDEDDCPGRVDIGREGCGHIGPTWNFN